MKIVLDGGPALSYRFAGNNRLSLVGGDAAAVQAGYAAPTLDRVTRWERGVVEFGYVGHGRGRSGVRRTGQDPLVIPRWFRDTSVLSHLRVANCPRRGARMARREERAYSVYASDEQRSQPGCPARRIGNS
jgi:hypothetical protein